MVQQQDITDAPPTTAIETLRANLPAECYVLFTPCGGMFVSPDPQDIKRSIDTLTNQMKGST